MAKFGRQIIMFWLIGLSVQGQAQTSELRRGDETSQDETSESGFVSIDSTTLDKVAQAHLVAAPFVVRIAPGFQAGWFLKPRLVADFTYIGTVFNSKAKTIPFNIHGSESYWNQYTLGTRYFFGQSFYGGVSYSELHSGDRAWISLRRTSLGVHIGNEWVADSGLSCAIDWIGYDVPLFAKVSKSASYMAEDGSNPTGNETRDVERQLQLPFTYLLTLRFGYTFLK